MPVSDLHILYTKNLNRWQIVRDCVEGSDMIKNARSFGTQDGSNSGQGLFGLPGTRYLPPPNPRDVTQDNIDRYRAYRDRANFVNFTGHTKDGFMGMVGRKEPDVELQGKIAYLKENADGAGLNLFGLINRTVSELLETGRYGLLAESPVSTGGTVNQTKDLKATIKTYPAESIINWRTSVIGYRTVLTMVVLAEQVAKISGDGFESTMVTNYRVLFIEDGVYKINLYDEDLKIITFKDNKDIAFSNIVPKKFDGSTWDIIPFVFIGSINNDPTPDKAPLYDLAEINIAHYRNSADFEESSFIVGQPTPVISGLTTEWAQDILKGGVVFGSRTAILLGVDQKAELLQAESNSMPVLGMELKETQMVKTGAKVISDSGKVETAEAAKIRFAGQNSKLGMIVINAQMGILKVFGWVGQYMNASDDNKLVINTQFYDATVNPQLIMANIQMLDRGIVAKSDLRTHARKTGLISPDRTDEDIIAENLEDTPL